MGFVVPRASGVHSRLSCPSTLLAALGLSSGKPDTPVAIEDAIVAGPPDQRLGR
jgi:hypothetical protein